MDESSDNQSTNIQTEPVVGTEATVPPVVNKSDEESSKPGKKRKFLVLAIFLSVLLLGGAGAAYNNFVLNSPENLWEKSLKNSAAGIDKLIAKSGTGKKSEGVKFDGNFKLESPVAASGRVTSKSFKQDSVSKVEFGYAGINVDAEVRTKTAEGSNTPDVYLKLDGLSTVSQLLDPQIGELLSMVDGNWYVADHDTIGQLMQGAEESPMQLSQEELNAIVEKSMVVLKDSFFSAEEGKAVLNVEENVGKEDFEGEPAYHYKVSINKENLKKFLVEYKQVINDTKLNALLMKNSGDTTEMFDSMIESVDSADFSKVKFDVWVDTSQKIIRNIRITPAEQESGTIGYFDIGIPYEGGDVLPLKFTVNTGKEEATGNEMIFVMSFKFNSATSEASFGFNMSGTMGGTALKASGDFTATSSDEAVSVDAPEDAQNIMELFGGLLGGGGFTQSSLPIDEGGSLFGFGDLPLDGVEL